MTLPRATIDCAALRNNLGVVRRLAPESRIMAVIKADAYGHGMIAAAKALSDADAFGVARFEEGLHLRRASIDKPVVLLEGVLSDEQLAGAAQHRLQLIVHSFEQVAMLERCSSTHRFDVWLKLDTGMNRLGFRGEEFAAALRRVQQCKALGKLRLMTHLIAGEEPSGATTQRQIASFESFAKSLHFERSIANSAGIIATPEARTEWVRPGLMLYGISPLATPSAAELGLRPVMTRRAQLIAIRTVKAAEGVGYGSLWRATRDSRVGIVAIGYGDGYPRGMRSGAPVLIGTREAVTAGRVSMDMIALDLTQIPDARVGEEVTLWGEGLPAERVAPFADTVPYELVCRLKERVTREWIDAEAGVKGVTCDV